MGIFGGVCFKCEEQEHKVPECPRNLNANIRKEGMRHISQGVEMTTRSMVGDNLDEVQ